MSKYRKQNNRAVGARYEKAAGYYLEQMGYVILQYNYRCKLGEIDMIAQDGAYLVFCEVKYRKGAGQGSPLAAVDPRKQRVIWQCAEYYLMEHGKTGIPCRFDVIGIGDGKIELIKNAFFA